MADRAATQRVKSLTGRQCEVLRLVCEGMDYGSIGDELFITKNAVKSHMVNIYRKLDLDHLPPQLRIKQIFEIYCPILKGLPIESNTEPEPVVELVDEVIEGMVVADESAIVLFRPKPITVPPSRPQPRGQQRRRPRRAIGCGLVLLLVLAAAIGVGIVLDGQGFGLGDILGTQVVAETTPVVIVVTATTGPTDPGAAVESTQSGSVAPEKITTEVLPSLTPQPEPTNTLDLNTAPGSIVDLGDWWKTDDFWLRLKSADISDSGGVWIILEMWNKTSDSIAFQWNTSSNFSLKDNTGHVYPLTAQFDSLSDNEILNAGEVADVRSGQYGFTVIYQDTSLFGASVTELILKVIEFPRIPEAEFRIVVPK